MDTPPPAAQLTGRPAPRAPDRGHPETPHLPSAAGFVQLLVAGCPEAKAVVTLNHVRGSAHVAAGLFRPAQAARRPQASVAGRPGVAGRGLSSYGCSWSCPRVTLARCPSPLIRGSTWYAARHEAAPDHAAAEHGFLGFGTAAAWRGMEGSLTARHGPRTAHEGHAGVDEPAAPAPSNFAGDSGRGFRV